MEALYNPELYGTTIANEIETMGTQAVAIANRWATGSPETVMALLVAREFLPMLRAQNDLELDVLAEETGMRHLSPTEILTVHGVELGPPSPRRLAS
jgi:hypothetical protein